jgi:hypothetical protein
MRSEAAAEAAMKECPASEGATDSPNVQIVCLSAAARQRQQNADKPV